MVTTVYERQDCTMDNMQFDPNGQPNDVDNMGFDAPVFSGEASEPVADMPEIQPAAEAAPQEPQQPRQRKRRKRSKWEIFKEAYLPAVIVGLAVILIIVFIVGAVRLAKLGSGSDKPGGDSSSTQPSEDLQSKQEAEAKRLLQEAEKLAKYYDYQGAVNVLEQFSGDLSAMPELQAKYNEYKEAFGNLVAWTDANNIPNLAFNLLIADPARAFADSTYGAKYNQNYVTTEEFSKILEQLYANNYMLVSIYDVATMGDSGYKANKLYLPAGKKPIVLTQHAVNYFTYMVDSDGDKLPDQGGAGFASRLVLDSTGKVLNEYVDASGNTVTGAYDLIPILDAFVEEHPDFSYHGAKATISVCGYDGLFGYRTNASAKERLGADAYAQEVAGATAIAEALKNSGYVLACHSYENSGYGQLSSSDITADLAKWTEEVTPILGEVNVLVLPFGSDIGNGNTYSGNKFNVLYNFGFRYFIGMDSSVKAWTQLTGTYVRQMRRWVTGSNMTAHASWYSDLFDAAAVLDKTRPAM